LPAAAALFLALGCGFRIIRYAQNLPLWSDECFLAVNFIGRGYLELLQPLDNGQIAPLLFLWVQRFTIDLAGFSEWGLRLFPLLCGLASVFLFWRLAGRVLGFREKATLLAVGIFAVSVHPIRHAAEAKPYASDLLASLILLVPAVEWLRRRDAAGWLWTLAALVPLALLLSNPAVFVAGAVGLGLSVPAWRTGRWACRLALGSFGVALVAVFTLLYTSLDNAQSAGAIPGLRHYWASSFPPVGEPWRLPGWLIAAHTGSAMAYPGGGGRGASTATLIAFLVGVWVLVRRGDGAILTCLAASFGLALLAAAQRRYPYGSEARLMQFAAPGICLLAGLGAATVLDLIRCVRARRAVLKAGLAGLVACGIVPQIVSWAYPYRMLYDQQQREFARRFWVEQARGAELACAHLDYRIDPPGSWQGRRAWYLCNQAIYSPQCRGRGGNDGGPARCRAISADRPLRCVVCEGPPESPGFRKWLDRMCAELTLRDVKTIGFEVTIGEGKPAAEHWRVFEFVPPTGRPTRTDIARRVGGG
jgi:hypothetical protein